MADKDDMARIKYSKGRTINLGNFESIRVDVGIELDAAVPAIAAAMERMKKWVEKELEAENKKVREETRG